MPVVAALDEAPFRESDHPRAENGEFGAGGGNSGAAKPAKKPFAEKLKAHTETFRKHGAETREWLKDKSAGEVLTTVAKNEKTKEALSFALQSLLSHATGLDQSTWKLNEDLIETTVHHFGDIAEITAIQAKSVMRKAVQGLLALRGGPKTVAGDEADGVAEMLKALLDLLDDGEEESTPANDADFNEADHPRKTDGKFGSGGGAGGAASESGRDLKSAESLDKLRSETLKAPLSDVEVTSIKRYAHEDYYGTINHELRESGASGSYAGMVRNIDSAFAKASLPHPVTLYRGVPAEVFAALEVGGAAQDKAYSSTTVDEGATKDFGDHILEIRAPAGTQAIPIGSLASKGNENEHEVLLNRGTKFRVISKTGNKAVLEIVNDASSKDADTPAMDERLAFDRSSVRRVDQDGHLFVEVTPISKANVCPYLGREIPDFESLGLKPEQVYQLYRDPEEIAKAAPSFVGKPLMLKHRAVSADDHPHAIVVGSVGTNVEFRPPYLVASLSVWDGDAIDLIEAGSQKELSSAYRYRADMTPGTVDGVRYDGVMRDIRGNHVALVREGRAGNDVVVGDSNEEIDMATKQSVLSRKAAVAHVALQVYFKPKLAQDAKIDLPAMLSGITAKNFGEKKVGLAAEIKKQTNGKLAKDASVEDVVDLLDSLEKIDAPDVIEAAVADPAAPVPLKDDTATDTDNAELRALLVSLGISEENITKILTMAGSASPAMDAETPEQKKAREDKEKTAKDAENAKMKDMVTKPAMDAAIAAAVKLATDTANKNAKALREAERAVRPYVGELVGMDSADAVYAHALTALGVEGVADIHTSAYPAMLKAIPVPGSQRQRAPIAQDSASASASTDLAKMFPGFERIGVLS